MPGMEGMGKLLIIAGIVLIGLGVLFTLGAKFGMGRLPGDIFIHKGNYSFYFPIVSSIVLSLVLTLLFNFISRR
jgi:hypothetical protein